MLLFADNTHTRSLLGGGWGGGTLVKLGDAGGGKGRWVWDRCWRERAWAWRSCEAVEARALRSTILVAAGALMAIGCAGVATGASADGTSGAKSSGSIMHVVFETGNVEIGVDTNRAPISAANFLAYVDAGLYNGATIYRAAQKSGAGTIGVLQGGLLAAAMSGDAPYLGRATPPLPAVAHETTHVTGIPNERGTIALARMEPGTAASEFFFNMRDNPELDTDAGVSGRDGFRLCNVRTRAAGNGRARCNPCPSRGRRCHHRSGQGTDPAAPRHHPTRVPGPVGGGPWSRSGARRACPKTKFRFVA